MRPAARRAYRLTGGVLPLYLLLPGDVGFTLLTLPRLCGGGLLILCDWFTFAKPLPVAPGVVCGPLWPNGEQRARLSSCTYYYPVMSGLLC